MGRLTSTRWTLTWQTLIMEAIISRTAGQTHLRPKSYLRQRKCPHLIVSMRKSPSTSTKPLRSIFHPEELQYLLQSFAFWYASTIYSFNKWIPQPFSKVELLQAMALSHFIWSEVKIHRPGAEENWEAALSAVQFDRRCPVERWYWLRL